MLMPMLFVAGILLVVFYLLDSFFYRREETMPKAAGPHEKLRIEGGVNILLLAGVVAAVLMSGAWKPGIDFSIYHVEIELQNVVRDLLLIMIAFLSLWLTATESRQIGRAARRGKE